VARRGRSPAGSTGGSARARIELRVQPGARERGVGGWRADGSLKVKVTEPPEDGRANRAVIELLAERLGVRAAAVMVVRGASSRSKTVEVTGLTPGELRARLAAAGGQVGDAGDAGDE
jgi:uncharacterized protein (TIGR00251 family)